MKLIFGTRDRYLLVNVNIYHCECFDVNVFHMNNDDIHRETTNDLHLFLSCLIVV
jgi:hypothetical protein